MNTLRLTLLLCLARLCLGVGSALAQSVPNPSTPISQGNVWTPAQWVIAFQSKVDVNNGSLVSPTISNPTFTGAFQSGVTAPGLTLSGTSTQGGILFGGPPVWTGATNQFSSQLFANVVFNGTPAAGTWTLHDFTQIQSNINAGNAGAVWGSSITLNSGTGIGGLTGFVDQIVLQAPTGNSLNVEYVGGRDWAYALSGDNGGLGTELGSVYGRTTVAGLHGSASHLLNQSAQEFAVDTWAGATVARKTGIFILNYATDAVQGSVYDIGIGLWRYAAATATSGWKVGLGFGNSTDFQPLATNATAIKFTPGPGDSVTIATAIDFSAATISSNALNFPGFKVDGSGNLFATSVHNFAAGNFNLNLWSSGNGGFNLQSTDGIMLQIGNQSPGSAITTYFSVQPAAGSLLLTTAGGAANQSIFINSQGAGAVIGFQGGAPVQIDVSGNMKMPTLANASAPIRIGSAASDVIVGSGANFAALNATAGFLHLPFTNVTSGAGGIPTGTPASATAPSCVWNDVSFNLDCYSPSAAAWKHVVFSAGAG